jgi:WD40 repeat protein
MRPTVLARFTGHTGAVYALAGGTREGSFLSAGSDGHVVEWDLAHPETGQALVNVGLPVYSLLHTVTHRQLLIGDASGNLHRVDLARRAEVQVVQVQHRGIYAQALLPGGRLVCAAGDGHLACFTHSPGLTLERLIPLCDEKLRGLSVNADGTLLAVAAGDGSVRVFETTDLNELHTIQAHEGGALCAAFHPTKPVLVTGGKDGHLRTWSTGDAFRPVLAIPAHKAAIYQLAFDPDGTQVATAGRDKHAKLWEATTLAPVARLDRPAGGHQHSVNALHWLGDVLLTAGDDRTIVAWNLGSEASGT